MNHNSLIEEQKICIDELNKQIAGMQEKLLTVDKYQLDVENLQRMNRSYVDEIEILKKEVKSKTREEEKKKEGLG